MQAMLIQEQLQLEAMDLLSVRVTALLPVICLIIHCSVVIGKYFWRKKHGLTRKLWPEFLTVGGFWFCLSAGVLLFYAKNFHHYSIQFKPAQITMSYFPFKTVKLPLENFDMLQVVKPEESGRMVRRGWKVEIHGTDGTVWRSLNIAPRRLKNWPSERIYRRDLMSYMNLFEADDTSE